MGDEKKAQALTGEMIELAKASGVSLEVFEVSAVALLANLVLTRADGDPDVAVSTMLRYGEMVGAAIASAFPQQPAPFSRWDLGDSVH